MPFSAKCLSRLRGTASVKLRLNVINSRQSIRASPLTPCPRIRTSASIASAPLISTLFGSLPPGGTSPAEGTVIYQCDRPPCSTHSRARRLRGSAGADDHEIVGFHEVVPSKNKSRDGQVAPVAATSLSALASSCALIATMIVLSDMRAAPIAGLMTTPHG